MPLDIDISQQPDTPVQKRDYNDLQGLINELGAPKQSFDQPLQPGEQPGSSSPAPGASWNQPYQEPITAEEAKQSGLRIAKTINTTFAFLAGLYAKSEDTQKYKASESEVSDLADPLSEIAEKYNYKISPEIRFIFLLVTIYAPRVIMAANDRRINQLEDRIKVVEDKLAEKEAKLGEKDPDNGQSKVD